MGCVFGKELSGKRPTGGGGSLPWLRDLEKGQERIPSSPSLEISARPIWISVSCTVSAAPPAQLREPSPSLCVWFGLSRDGGGAGESRRHNQQQQDGAVENHIGNGVGKKALLLLVLASRKARGECRQTKQTLSHRRGG
ncbi:unnamed protein product [Linum trigynum]|uniref:Uncharacterized protein n=1 Tax=Linum trigynum TaxID=586398 RepID=A0AAV2CHY5_9ROSI